MTSTHDKEDGLLSVPSDASIEDVVASVRAWITSTVPAAWIEAGRRGGPAAVREVRTRAEYEAWYPVFGRSGLVAATWPRAYGGLDLSREAARQVEQELSPFNLGRLNPLGLNLAAPALFAHGTEEQRLRFLPPIVRNEEAWCQLFSEPGAGSDLASLATKAERDGDEWVITGQKVWTTWAHLSDWAVLLARTDVDVPKRQGLTYFLIDLHQPGVDVRPLRHMGGEVDFNEVFLEAARVSDAVPGGRRRRRMEGGQFPLCRESARWCRARAQEVWIGSEARVSAISFGWRSSKVPKGVLAGGMILCAVRRSCVSTARSASGSGRTSGCAVELRAGRAPGPESSVGKVHQGELNQRVQLAAMSVLGMRAMAWVGDLGDYAGSLPYEVRGMLRSRANTIEGGTTEINKNILGERVLGLPREPDPYSSRPWTEVPRS